MIFGSPALRWLVRAKLRGTLRKQLRRLKQPSGIVLGILGFLIFGFWFLSLALGIGLQDSMFEEETDARLVRLGCLAMVLITVTGAFSHRGVVMPREEIERLFAAPVSRADIVRYRMLTNSGRYLLSGVVFALFVSRHLPHPIFGPASVFVAMLTLPLLGQTAALLLGSAEHRFADSWRKGTRARLLRGITLVLVFGVILFMTFGRNLVHLPSLENVSDLGGRVLDWPPVRYVLALFTPWSNAMVSTTKEEFGPSFGILIAFWIVLFEFAARLPVDFRELSLDTSANVAKRIREMRSSGLGASSGKASRGRLGKRIPWLFGRSPFGAVAWMKLGSLLRKAKGTLVVSVLILTGMTAFAVFLSREGEDKGWVPVGLAVFLTIYLCGALRFDFRADIDRLEAFKSWPLRPARLFVANLLPQVFLVSLAVAIATSVHFAMTKGPFEVYVSVLLGAPFLVMSWTALDNAVFLLLPQRTIAGQEGMLQHLGRSLILIATRTTVFVLVAGLATILAFGVGWLADRVEISDAAKAWSIFGALLLLLFVVDFALVGAGGWALRRLDVSRIPK